MFTGKDLEPLHDGCRCVLRIPCPARGPNAEESVSRSSRSADDLKQLVRDLRVALEAEQHYLRSGDRAALDSAAAVCSRWLEHAAFSSAGGGVRVLSPLPAPP